MERVVIYKDGRAYFPRRIARDLEGKVPIIWNALTLTLTRETDPAQIAHSLAITIQDVYLRQGKRVKVSIEPLEP